VRELGIGVAPVLGPAEMADLAERVETLGFDVLSVFGDLGMQPPIPALLIGAARTRRVRLGPGCMNPYTTHPMEIAGQIAYVDAVSGGRAYLGLARGAWLDRPDSRSRGPSPPFGTRSRSCGACFAATRPGTRAGSFSSIPGSHSSIRSSGARSRS